MIQNPLARAIGLGTLGMALCLPLSAQAAFIEDSKASLELRNFYMNKDFRHDSATQSKQDEWAQGFLLRYESGFTEGTVGVGLDLYGFAGYKLDSGGGTSGTGLLLPKNHKGKVPSSYGEAGGAVKFKLSETILRAGTLMPKLPTVSSGDSRLLPQTFTGVHLNSKEIKNLTVDAGRLNRVNQRNSTHREAIPSNRAGENFRTNAGKSSEFDFAGLSYVWGESGLRTSYNYANLQDVYKQSILNGVYTFKIDDKQSLTTDLRYAKTSEDGKSKLDNKAFSGMVTYRLGHSSFSAAYQKMSGKTGYVYLAGTDPFLTNYVQVRDFGSKDEKSWQARYTYDFAGLGIPGLTFMTRYISGDNIDRGANKSRGKAWERDTDIAYAFQDGPLKNLSVRWRNATVRSHADVSGDIDENRLIVSYTIPLL